MYKLVDLNLFIKFDGTGRKGGDKKLYYCLSFFTIL